ncbi:helix-turn-helix domain-containing protein [Streptomyces sp. MMG1533]|uniref:helix-turn-helix domain-containing protein n=1 Tax=Streptomyces sp. MMG1533 TaxID=1415546 RepID=UPI00099D3C89|nr:helix-turn-helix transcriptional regulator [Streptomyces sp. MMG1533]
MGDVLAVQPGRIPAVGLGPMLNAARLRRGWRLREAARPLGLSASYLLDVEAGLCRPSRAVAELLADGLQLNDTARAQLFACGDVADLGHPAGAQSDAEGQEPRRGAGLTPFVAASSTGAPTHGPRAVLVRERWPTGDLGGVRGDSERTR